MGKLGRFACILTPMLCTLASLVCTLIVMVGGTNKGSDLISGLYFLRIDTRHIDTPGSLDLIPGMDIDDDILSTGLNLTAGDLGLDDFYTSSLWNYCSGKVEGDKWKITECGKPSATYSFDPIRMLNVEAEGDDINFPDSVERVSKTVNVASRVMIAMYVLGFVSTLVTFAVGWFGLLSRWGSCVTTILADISFFFLLTGSVLSTALYISIRETFNKGLKDFSVSASINNQMFMITWLGVAFSFASCIFWMMSTCCCSGRRSRVMGTDHKPAKPSTTRGGYERISAPYVGGTGNNVPMTQMGKKQNASYEPYRHS